AGKTRLAPIEGCPHRGRKADNLQGRAFSKPCTGVLIGERVGERVKHTSSPSRHLTEPIRVYYSRENAALFRSVLGGKHHALRPYWAGDRRVVHSGCVGGSNGGTRGRRTLARATSRTRRTDRARDKDGV